MKAGGEKAMGDKRFKENELQLLRKAINIAFSWWLPPHTPTYLETSGGKEAGRGGQKQERAGRVQQNKRGWDVSSDDGPVNRGQKRDAHSPWAPAKPAKRAPSCRSSSLLTPSPEGCRSANTACLQIRLLITFCRPRCCRHPMTRSSRNKGTEKHERTHNATAAHGSRESSSYGAFLLEIQAMILKHGL
ncbi:hypothetical protein F2P81_024969 [Scophthalmus maximus]|uniref:Uncharacterized protein n=1 Tax=Scophthalmus maximus TaxID=52904 RepID=A0A6A4RSG9_SCOMX|nr:hypothetical protein F2P81_024969 [Scophthalmus maximus]